LVKVGTANGPDVLKKTEGLFLIPSREGLRGEFIILHLI
jgi:hypothetical protein